VALPAIDRTSGRCRHPPWLLLAPGAACPEPIEAVHGCARTRPAVWLLGRLALARQPFDGDARIHALDVAARPEDFDCTSSVRRRASPDFHQVVTDIAESAGDCSRRDDAAHRHPPANIDLDEICMGFPALWYRKPAALRPRGCDASHDLTMFSCELRCALRFEPKPAPPAGLTALQGMCTVRDHADSKSR